MELVFEIEGGDFTSAGNASSKIKKVLKQLNIDSKTIKRIVIAVYEAEVNIVAHAKKGILKASIGSHFIEVKLTDKGPGIEDVEKAMEAGFSTASKQVREMGFGAGMGLPNIKKNVDELDIVSEVGKGTLVKFKNYF
ncbi:anti-sigma regulatory factor [Maribellus comscasis]|uniref:Anti-sigma regulatory factor n=1 Tax=Maribellus comscasis TaxID=2681766 RepID=A0A6I6JX04_9BACT|nr:ATP-binding protein [Maribellus comscasis]QGY45670.1 anti-sigma regulatory factor [Maribellus comscasis]